MALFADFFAALPQGRYCAGCLAEMYYGFGTHENVNEPLRAMGDRILSERGMCATCYEESETFSFRGRDTAA